MKRFFAAALAVLAALCFPACAAQTKQPSEEAEGDFLMKAEVTVNGQKFSASLAENETARAFAAKLPLTLEMRELNGNEKYFYLQEDLPAQAARPGRIEAGDIMLYGSSCIVLYYESFSTSYSYTRIGKIDDAAGLATAAGTAALRVTFALAGG